MAKGKTFDGIEDYILTHWGVSLDDINSEDELDSALQGFYDKEYKRVGTRANVIKAFYKNQAYFDAGPRISNRLETVQTTVNDTLKQINDVQNFDEFDVLKSEYGSQDRFSDQIRATDKRLQNQSNDLARNLIDQISSADTNDLLRIDPEEYRGKQLTNGAVNRLKDAINRRIKELAREE